MPAKTTPKAAPAKAPPKPRKTKAAAAPVVPTAAPAYAERQEAPAEMMRLSGAAFDNALAAWLAVKEKIDATVKPLLDEEMRLRKLIFISAWLDPEEGTNVAELGNGYKLRAVHKINREIDERVLPDALKCLPPGSRDFLIKDKPNLVLAVYRTLPADMRIAFDKCVIEKPASPSLEFVVPVEAS